MSDEHQPDAEPTEPTPPEVPQPPPVATMPASAHQPRSDEKTPVLAAVLSVAPGLGNVYNGLYGRGIAFFLIQFALLRIAIGTNHEEDLAFLVPSLIFFWLFNIFDAYRQATLINLGQSPDAIALSQGAGNGLMLPGVLLAAIGLLGIFDRYFGIYLWDVLDHWPLLALAFGIFLVWRSMNSRNADRTE